MKGMAADMAQLSGVSLETMCSAAETALAKHKIPGSIIKYPTFVHVDTSPTRYRGINNGKTLTKCNGWTPMAATPSLTPTAAAVTAPSTTPTNKSYQVQITTETDPLNVRALPHINSAFLRTVPKDSIQTIVKESTGAGAKMWGQLPTSGWISLDYTRKI